MIVYLDSADGVTPDMLQGFCAGWRTPLTPEKHLAVLENSSHIVLALDDEAACVVGFVTALTDGLQAAFIPLLEVLSDYQGRGIGMTLMEKMLAKLAHLPAIDLTCNPDVQPFYAKLGMTPSVGMIVRHYPANP